jgi:hypothetical protein
LSFYPSSQLIFQVPGNEVSNFSPSLIPLRIRQGRYPRAPRWDILINNPTLSSLVPTSRKGFLDGGTDLPTVTVIVYGIATQYVGAWLLPASIIKDEELTAGEPARPTVIKTVYETTTVSTGTWYITTIGESSGSTSMTRMPLSEVTTTGVSHDVMAVGNSPTSSSPFNYPTMSGMSDSSSTTAAIFPMTGITAEIASIYRLIAEASRPPNKPLPSNLYS